MNSTISAISTPNAAGGIGIVRLSGENACEIADKIFFSSSKKTLKNANGYTAHFGKILDNHQTIDQAIAVVYKSPKSYTGEDVVELQCHGGLFVLQQVLRLTLENGARLAEAGEFTKRAFLNGKMDLTSAESVMKIIGAKGKEAANAAIQTLEGSLTNEINEIKSSLVNSSATLSAWIDYPDEEIEELQSDVLINILTTSKKKLENLINKFDAGQAITEGINTVIVGKPNVGKSTLMNLLLQKNRSIVTDIAGTTRDIVEETARVGNVILHISDTAGIHESNDYVESIGIEYAKNKLSTATLFLAVFDGSKKLDEEDYKILELCKNKCGIAILNKADIGKIISENEIYSYIKNVISLSAKESDSLKTISNAIENVLGTNNFDSTAAMLSNERQLNCCKTALSCINEAIDGLEIGITLDAINVSIDAAISPLLELTGERVSEAVVNEIFSKFCVGK